MLNLIASMLPKAVGLGIAVFLSLSPAFAETMGPDPETSPPPQVAEKMCLPPEVVIKIAPQGQYKLVGQIDGAMLAKLVTLSPPNAIPADTDLILVFATQKFGPDIFAIQAFEKNCSTGRGFITKRILDQLSPDALPTPAQKNFSSDNKDDGKI